ncbi:MAG: threonine synthase [Planctomycetes bacterium]|nr:threonine synthase [Planctomycetota bacterium]
MTCPACGPEGTLDVHYDLDAARVAFARDLEDPALTGVWRYRALLPVADDGPRPPLQVGPTPLLRLDPARAPGGFRALWVKDDGRLPTASFKDRATSVAVARALEAGAPGLLCASTGNAASSLAGFCAAAGLRAVILVPRSAPRAKLAQLLVYGAELFPVAGTYDDAFDLSLPAAEALGLMLRSTGVNPYLAEGKKTGALELAEQFAWDLPEWIAVSVGDGCIVSGLYKGFKDLVAIGRIPRVPKLLGVQAAGSDALTRAWEAGLDAPAQVEAKTCADSISVDRPRDGRKALRAIRESGGAFLRVSDEAILAAMPALARASGVFSEPAGAAALAGLLRAKDEGLLDADTPCVAWVTGSGLKDADAAIRAAGGVPEPIEPTLEALEAALRARR